MRAIDAVRRPIVTMPADATYQAVAQRMEHDAVGAVVIVDGDRPVGIVTDRDLVVRALAVGTVDGRVDSVMQTDLVVAEADGELRDVVHKFGANAVRRVVLERDGVAVGLLSVDDLLVDLVADLADVVRPVTAEVLFGHHAVAFPVATGGAA